MARYPSTVMVTAVCPWDEQERLVEDVFRRQLRLALENGFRRIYVFGTAGEGYAVDTARFRRVVEVFGDELLGGPAVPMVGVIGLSTGNVVERLQIAYDLGFRDFQISLPSWAAVTDQEVLRYFVDVCGTFPDSNFMHYNSARTRRILTGTEYRWLVEAVPNLVATKLISSDLSIIGSAVRDAPKLMHFLTEQTIGLWLHVRRMRAPRHLRDARPQACLDTAGGSPDRAIQGSGGHWDLVRTTEPRSLRSAIRRYAGRWRLRQGHRQAGRSDGPAVANALALPMHQRRGVRADSGVAARALPRLRLLIWWEPLFVATPALSMGITGRCGARLVVHDGVA